MLFVAWPSLLPSVEIKVFFYICFHMWFVFLGCLIFFYSSLHSFLSRVEYLRLRYISFQKYIFVFCMRFSRYIWLIDDQSAKIRSLPGLNHSSSILFLIWQPPTLPYRLQYSTLGRLGLNLRVRNVNGCFPETHRHQKDWALNEVFSNLVRNLFFATWWGSFEPSAIEFSRRLYIQALNEVSRSHLYACY